MIDWEKRAEKASLKFGYGREPSKATYLMGVRDAIDGVAQMLEAERCQTHETEGYCVAKRIRELMPKERSDGF